MVRTRTGEQLDDWLERVRASKIRGLQGFVAGVERDKAAVRAGLTLPQNNGLGDRESEQAQTRSRAWAMVGQDSRGSRQRVLHAQ